MKIKSKQEVMIESLSHEGRGVTHCNGKTTFVDNALPNEKVIIEINTVNKNYNVATAVEILSSSADRVQPKCQHYAICGGCSLQHMDSSAQILFKQAVLLEQLEHFGGVKPKSVLSPLVAESWGYRRKARLGVRYVTKKQKILVGFREKNGRYLADLEFCEVLDSSVAGLIQPLAKLIEGLTSFQQIAQVEVAVGDDATALVIRHLVPLPETDLQQWNEFAKQNKLHIYLQPGGLESIHKLYPAEGRDELSYRLPDYQLELFFHPSDFTQVNAAINIKMLRQALALLSPGQEDTVLDLFCGLGNFSLPLAKHAKFVVGVEGDMRMVERASDNARRNDLTNVMFHKANLAGDFSGAPWARQKYNKILLDPPRSGAAEVIPHLKSMGSERIVYVSCNPATLARDAGELVKLGYKLETVGVMDMFPHTSHVESMALFTR